MLMAYTKTQWYEDTPITVDRLNKIETGIANGIDKTEQIMEIPITNDNGWQQFRWTKPNYNTISWTRDAKQSKALEIFNETNKKQLLVLCDDGGLDVKKYFTVNGGDGVGHADLFLQYNGKYRGLLRGLAEGGLQLHSYNVDGSWANNINMVAGLITLGSDTKVVGHLTTTGGLNSQGKLAFSNYGSGGGLNANVHNLALHATTGNGQMITAGENKIYVGNPQTPLVLESQDNPLISIGGAFHRLIHTGSLTQKMTFGKYSSNNWSDAQIEINAGTSAGGVARLNFHRENHSQMSIIHKDRDKLHVELDNGTQQRILTDGDSCARFSWNGSRISIDGGGNNAAVSFSDVSEITNYLRNHHTGQNFPLRASAGLGPVDGWLTMTW